MNTRALMISAACLYLMAASQLHAEIPYQHVLMIPEPGELVPNPSFFVIAKEELISKAMALSEGELYLSPLESNEEPSVEPVPLTVTQRYRPEVQHWVFLELSPTKPLILGVSYQLQAKAGTAAEFIDMGIGTNTGKVWTVVPPTNDSTPALPRVSPAIAFYLVESMNLRSQQLFLSAVLDNETAGLSGLIALGKDKNGKLLSTNVPGLKWTPRTMLSLTHMRCFLDRRRWTHVRSVEVIPLGTRGERGESTTLPVRVNPVVTSVFGSLPRLAGKTYCRENH